MTNPIIQPSRVYHVGCSSGKDSSGLLLWLCRESGIPASQIRATFTNIGNDAPETIEHIAYLSREVHPIETIYPPLDFYQLARKKGRFPGAKSRFCTQELKMKPSKAYIDGMLAEGLDVVPCSGVRKEESESRAKLTEWGNPLESYYGLAEWRPLLEWKIEEVFLLHRRHGVRLNPLYAMGMSRVGCLPCIMSRKSEIRRIAKNFPERIEFLAGHEWVDENGYHGFRPRKSVPQAMCSETYTSPETGIVFKVPSIRDAVAWSFTKDHIKDNKQYALDFWFDDPVLNDFDAYVCPSTMGACE